MKYEKDYEDFIKSLNKHKVKYCIVGAFAVAIYGKPRYTKDIDILIEASIENGARLVAALDKFGFRSPRLCKEDFIKPKTIIQLGYEPVRIDIITSITGCTFKEIWDNKKAGKYGNIKAYYIGLRELLKNKKASKRKQDKADLEQLLRLQFRHCER